MHSTHFIACVPQHAQHALYSMHRLFDTLVQSHRRLTRRSSLSACSRQVAPAVRHSWWRPMSQLRQPTLSCSTRWLASMHRQQSCRMSLCNSRSLLGGSGEPAGGPPSLLPPLHPLFKTSCSIRLLASMHTQQYALVNSRSLLGSSAVRARASFPSTTSPPAPPPFLPGHPCCRPFGV